MISGTSKPTGISMESVTLWTILFSVALHSEMRNYSLTIFLLSAFSHFSVVQGFSVSNSRISRPSTLRLSPLFQLQQDATGKTDTRTPFSFSRRLLGRKSKSSKSLRVCLLSLAAKIRRSLLVVAASALIWFGSAGIHAPPSHASSSAAAVPSQSRSIMSVSVEQIVDQYVQDHMFDDDVYDPVESVYREAIGDKVRGTHPKAISEITVSVLGQDGMKAEKTTSSSSVGDWIMNAVGFLQRKGLSETAAIIILTGSVVFAGPTLFLLAATMAGSQSKRQILGVMKKRYGDTYT